MDELRDYIKQNEERLNVERMGGHVWMQINQALNAGGAAHSQKNVRRSWFTFRKPAYRRWAFALAFVALLVFSMAFRIKEVERIGHVVSLNINSTDTFSIARLDAATAPYRLGLKPAKNRQPDLLSFVGFIGIANTELEKIRDVLLQISGIRELSLVPVEIKRSESLLSHACYKVFNKHLDVKKTTKEEVSREILNDLQSKGIENVRLDMDEAGSGIEVVINNDGAELPSNTINAADSAPAGKTDSPDTKAVNAIRAVHPALEDLKWVLHTWRTFDSAQNSHHRWIQVHDSLFRSFVITPGDSVAIRPAYYLYVRNGNVFLAIDNSSWQLKDRNPKQFIFEREDPRFPKTVRWQLRGNEWWFAQILGTYKDEIFLKTNDSQNNMLDSMLSGYKKREPALFR